MSTRTQIYLDEDQRRVLKMIAASSGTTMSDLVRRAIDRLLSDELSGKDLGAEMDAVVSRMRAAGTTLSDQQIDVLFEKRPGVHRKASA